MSDHSTEVTLDINEQIAIRRTKLADLRKSGQAYPNDFRRHDLAADLHAKYDQFAHDQLEEKAIAVQLAGRMMTRRLMGKASFVHIQDMSGRIQLYVKQDDLSPEIYEAFKRWDLGDILGVKGILFKTKTDELSVKVTEISLLTKSLLPLPDKFHGLTDQEMRYRKRYLDLIANDQSRQVFRVRSATVAAIRSFLDQRGYMEVETPMMHQIPGGAAARPFITHHNTLDMDLYLRIAPELYLKRLVVGGFERVYEINRNFRNEGLSTRHNPEFTMLEFYQAYADYNDLINLTEEMIRHVAEKVVGTLQITYQGNTYDLAKPFRRLTMEEAILKYNPKLTKQQLRDFDQAVQLAKQMEIPLHPHDGLGKIWYEIFERTVEAKLTEATFITAFPMEVSPLARKNDKDPFITDRFEFFIGGREIANGFSELNDPEDQAQRFREQVKSREHGDLEAMYYDADYITALEYGLPPTAGEGIGIDRLVMFLTDSSTIRDVILFPQMRPQED